MMKAQGQSPAARYDALGRRERALIGAAVLAAIVLAGYGLLIDPALKRGQDAQRSLLEQQTQLSGLQGQSKALQSGNSPDFAANVELAALKKELAQVTDRLARLESKLVAPQRMAALLEEMIGRKSSLRLIGLKTIALSPLLAGKAGADEPAKSADKAAKGPARRGADKASAAPGLYKHGIEIRLEGSYQDLTAYLERLEQAQAKLLWSSVSLSAEKHPKLVLTLTVYTVSLDSAWLIV